MTFKVGDEVMVKKEAWSRTLNTTYPPTVEIIIKVGRNYTNTQDIYYLGSFPFVYWNEEDLDLVCKRVEYEQVNSIFANNRIIKVDDRFHCLCEYEVCTIYPIWDKEGKHLYNDPRNTFATNLIASPHCPIHAQYSKGIKIQSY